MTAARGELILPGNIQAIIESPIFARSEGYLRQRLVDIGDQVRLGQLLAVVEAPEVDKQVQQAQATLSRAQATLAQPARLDPEHGPDDLRSDEEEGE